MNRLSLLVVLTLSLLVTACVSHEGAPTKKKSKRSFETDTAEYRYTVQRGLTYTPDGWPQELKADIYSPRGLGPYAAVLVIPGGGWESGERDDMDDFCERLAEHGYVAVTIDYRHAPQYKFPSQLHDVQQAVRWLRTKAESLSVEPDRIGVLGYSAGGHLAALLGSVGEGDPLDTPYGGSDTRVRAVVSGAGPTDLRKYEGGELVPQFIGGSREQMPDAFALASPITHVSANDPPMFFYHGTVDTLVPPDHSQDMKKALDAVNVPSELYLLSGLGHITAFYFDGRPMKAALNFLDRHLRAGMF